MFCTLLYLTCSRKSVLPMKLLWVHSEVSLAIFFWTEGTWLHAAISLCSFKFHGSQSKYLSLLQLLSDPFFTSQAQIICKWNRPTIFDPFALSCQAGLKWFSIQVQFHRDLAFFCPHLALSMAEEEESLAFGLLRSFTMAFAIEFLFNSSKHWTYADGLP